MTGIVIGIDGSAGAAKALQWAVDEGRARQWPVTAVLAWSYLDQHHPDAGATFDPAYDESAAKAALDTYLERVLGSDAGAVERLAVCDLAAPALLGAAADASLLVVGARGLGGFKGLLLGSVSRQIIDHAPCPVAVIREEHEPTGERPRVVVGTDGSTDALVAMRWAAEEAAARDGVLEVIHAWHLPAIGGYLDGAPQFDADVMEDYAARTLTESVAKLDTSGLSHPVEARLVHDRPAGALLDASRGADVVVVGRRGLGKVAGFLLGSTSLRVVHHASCPVVVIPGHAEG